MFYNISTITSNSYFYNYNSINIKNMSYMFYNCQSIIQLPDISILNTKNVNDMSFMFYNCLSLKQLPDISKWNIENVVNTNNMFENCFSLSSLPNISVWNTKKIKNMDFMFKNCKLLTNIPDFSKWDISEDNSNHKMFEGDEELEKKLGFTKKEKKLKNCLDLCCEKCDICLNCCNRCFIPCIILFIILIISSSLFMYLKNKEFIQTKKIVNDSVEYLYTLNYSNISYINKSNKIRNISKIKEILKNNSLFFNKTLNFTLINGNIKLESSLNKVKKILNIIMIIMVFDIISFCFAFINDCCFLMCVSWKTSIYFLIVFFIFDIISIIALIFDIILARNFKKSLKKYYNGLQRMFGVEIPHENKLEYEFLTETIIIILVIFIGMAYYKIKFCRFLFESNNFK